MTDAQVTRAAEVVLHFAEQRFPGMGFVIVPFAPNAEKEFVTVTTKCNRSYAASAQVAESAHRILLKKAELEEEGQQP